MTDIFDSIRKVNRTGVSVLMVEQNAIEALRISDQCIVMANGRVRLCSQAAKVLEMPDLQTLYLGDTVSQQAA